MTTAIEAEVSDGRHSVHASAGRLLGLFSRAGEPLLESSLPPPDALRRLFQADGLRDIVGESSRQWTSGCLIVLMRLKVAEES